MKKTAITLSIEKIDERINNWNKELEFDDNNEYDIEKIKSKLSELRVIRLVLIELRDTAEREQIKDAFESGCEHGENYHETDFDIYFKNTYENGE